MEIESASTQAAEGAIRQLLKFLGEDPNRNGLQDTPARVVRSLIEMTKGYLENPAEILQRTFEESYDEMIVLREVSFYSLCEHHLLPFHGVATIGYLPGQVVGISKLARLVQCYARRLQIQERMTRQIATDIEKYLNAIGVGVVVKAHHLCMGCRGVQQPGSLVVTSAMLGNLRERSEVRAEFLRLAML